MDKSSDYCPKCNSLVRSKKRNFSLYAGVLFVFAIAVIMSFNFSNVSELFLGAPIKENIVSFTLTGPPEFFAQVADYKDGQEEVSTVVYHVKLPVVVRNRSDSVLKLSSIMISVMDGRAEKLLKDYPEYSKVEANTTFARDLWVPVWMSKYDKSAKAWVLPKVEYGQSLYENFGKTDVVLHAEDDLGRDFTVGQQSFEIGKVALKVLPQ